MINLSEKIGIEAFDIIASDGIQSTNGLVGLASLYDYVLNSDENTEAERLEHSLNVIDSVIKKDAMPYDNIYKILINRGVIKLRILKLLNDIELRAKDKNIAVIARLIEMLASDPELDYDKAIGDFARQHGVTILKISRLIEREFNIYDPVFVDKVIDYTGSKPLTSSDILCDLALYVRKKFFMGGLVRA